MLLEVHKYYVSTLSYKAPIEAYHRVCSTVNNQWQEKANNVNLVEINQVDKTKTIQDGANATYLLHFLLGLQLVLILYIVVTADVVAINCSPLPSFVKTAL